MPLAAGMDDTSISKAVEEFEACEATPQDVLYVFIRELQRADRVVIEARNALGGFDAHYINAPDLLAALESK